MAATNEENNATAREMMHAYYQGCRENEGMVDFTEQHIRAAVATMIPAFNGLFGQTNWSAEAVINDLLEAWDAS